MPLTDAFSNTAPTGIIPSRASAFDNTAPASSTPGRGAAFSNTGPTAATVAEAAAFDNTKPGVTPTGTENYLARAQATTNIAPASVIAGSVMDFVSLADGDLVLLASQTNPAENGLYLVNGAGAAAVRATDHKFPFSVRVSSVGNVNRNKAYAYFPVFNYVVGTSSVTFTPLVATGRTV